MKKIRDRVLQIKMDFSKALPFSTFVSIATIENGPINVIALVILNALSTVRIGAAFSRAPAIETWVRSYPRSVRARARQRIAEAWSHLEHTGLLVETKAYGTFEAWAVTDRGKALLQQKLPTSNDGLLPADLINRELAQAAVPLYNDGKYDEACGAALKHLEILVRQASGLPDSLVGRELMAAAFKPSEGPLTNASAEMSEQLGLRDLMTGAMQFYRNPFAHREVGIKDPRQAASIILLVNELMAHARSAYLSRNNDLRE